MKKEETPIHIKLKYSEAFESKRDLLKSEASLLNLQKIVRRYNLFKQEERILKIKFYREMKSISANLKKLESILPKFKIPKIIKSPQREKVEIKKNRDQNDIEAQLRDIQQKLRELSR